MIMDIKVYKLNNIDFTNEESINNSIRDELKSINTDGVQLILEWDDVFDANPINTKVRALSAVIHTAVEYGYFNVFLMDPERNVYSLGFDTGVDFPD